MSKNGDSMSLPGLVYWSGQLRGLYETRGVNCAYAAAKQLHIILDMAATINIDSVPDSERERIQELQEQVNTVNTLLHRPAANQEAIFEGCDEAYRQLRYLFELTDPRMAAVLDALIATEEETCLSPTMTYSNH